MTRDDAEAFITKTEGRVCVRLYRRTDGTVITRDCPVGRRTLWRQTLALVAGVAGALLVAATGVLAAAGIVAARSNNWQLFQSGGPPVPFWPQQGEAIMGDMCIEEEFCPPAIESGEESLQSEQDLVETS